MATKFDHDNGYAVLFCAVNCDNMVTTTDNVRGINPNSVHNDRNCDRDNNQDYTIKYLNYDISNMSLHNRNCISLNKESSTIQYSNHRNIPYIVQDTTQINSIKNQL